MAAVDQTFFALADPTRLGVIDLLRRQRRCSSDLARALGTSRSAMSRHLRVLRHAGLVEEDAFEVDARMRMYRLRREPFAELRDWLGEVESFWDEQLDAFKSYAEAAKGEGSE